MKLLHIDSSITGPTSASRQLSAAVTAAFTRQSPGVDVTHRDLGADPLPHLDGQGLGHANSDANAELAEFLAADVIVIGAPMYNFNISSQLKAWLDRIVIAGKTFRYTGSGVEGLAGEKRVVIASSRGGLYGPGAPSAPFDFQETYLRAILGFIGVTDIEFVRAEGLAFGPDAREAALAAAIATAPSVVQGQQTALAA